jgi:cell cycle checkpoint protein
VAIESAVHLVWHSPLLSLGEPSRFNRLGRPADWDRNHQKILKPEFFEKFSTERTNLALLDSAAGYLARKAMASSGALSELRLDDDSRGHAPWGGMLSKGVLAGEVLPMMIKLQGMTKREQTSV